MRARLWSLPVLVPLMLVGCAGEKAQLPASDAAAPALGVRVEKPKGRLEKDLVRVTGALRAKQEAVLSAPATGTIQRLLVDVGDRVKKDQTLVQLDASNVYIAIEQASAARDLAQAQLDNAGVELERIKQLRSTDAAPAAMLDRALTQHKMALAGLAQAEAALKSAHEMLRDHALRAPFDAVITERFKNLGETVAMMPPTPIVALAATGELEVRIPAPETVANNARVGQVLRGRVSPSLALFEARVRVVGAVVDPQSRSVEVIADVTTAIDPALMRPGSLVEVDLDADDAAVAAIYVPSQAVQSEGEARFVYVVRDGVARRRAVQVEPVTPGVMRVREGLTADEQVVVEGAAGLRDGARVQVAS